MATFGSTNAIAFASSSGSKKSRLISLPMETLEGIFKYASPGDLLNLSVVCKLFHGLAAALLYRKIYLVLPDKKLRSPRPEVDSFAAAMDTLTTSDYNYNQFIKEVSIESTTMTASNRLASSEVLSTETGYHAGERFLNSLLLAALKGAASLESFRCDVRVELSRPLLLAFSTLGSLQNLHIRLPARSSTTARVGNTSVYHAHPHCQHNQHHAAISSMAHTSPNSTLRKPTLSRGQFSRNEDPLASFSGLKSLAVLDMDSLECVPAIKQCISNSSHSLKVLKISFSQNLASKARRNDGTVFLDPTSPNTEVDEASIPLPSVSQATPNSYAASATTVHNARRERAAQESVLAQIFDLQDSGSQQALDKAFQRCVEAADQEQRELDELNQRNYSSLLVNELYDFLIDIVKSGQKVPPLLLEAFEIMNGAAANCIEPMNKKGNAGNSQNPGSSSVGEDDRLGNSGDTDENRVDKQTEDARADTSGNNRGHDSTQMEQRGQAKSDAKGKKVVKDPPDSTGPVSKTDLDTRLISDYIRQNHGIPLESLSIHLIPVNPTVLCRAVDVSTLKHLSVLNVGPQRNLWTMLQKYAYPGRLTSIHTDNVTPSFLSFVNSLDKVTELFMFERSSRSNFKASAPKTTVRIEGIRSQILKKHVKHLRRLVIRNDENDDWALNWRSVRLLTKSGSNLIELFVGSRSKCFHQFMRMMTGLRSLVALQFILNTFDGGAGVLQEINTCAVDNIVHQPEVPLEYLAVACSSRRGLPPFHQTITQIIRKPAGPTAGHDTLSRTQKQRVDEQSESTSDESESETGRFTRPSVTVRPGIDMQDIVGIKMWEKGNWNMSL